MRFRSSSASPHKIPVLQLQRSPATRFLRLRTASSIPNLFNHVKTRVVVWKDPFANYDNGGYQVAQSLFAIGTGGWFGMGLFQGMPDNIPVADEDFIFSAISEELGLIFALCMILVCVSCKSRRDHDIPEFQRHLKTGGNEEYKDDLHQLRRLDTDSSSEPGVSRPWPLTICSTM